MATDERIVELCRQGRHEGFALLLKMYQDRVYRRAFSFLRHREDALDATQDVFVRVIPAIEHFRSGNPIWPWLRRITTNTCLNQIRTLQSRPQTLPLDAAGEQAEVRSAASDPEQAMLLAWDRKVLDKAVAELSPVQRIVVVLRHEEDMSYDEIAQTTGLPLGTVKTNLFRARRTLRELLQEEVRS